VAPVQRGATREPEVAKATRLAHAVFPAARIGVRAVAPRLAALDSACGCPREEATVQNPEAYAIRRLSGGGRLTVTADTDAAAATACGEFLTMAEMAGAAGAPTFQVVLIDAKRHTTLAEMEVGLEGWQAAERLCRHARARHGAPIVARVCEIGTGHLLEWIEENLVD
jgi:hypothetical protein